MKIIKELNCNDIRISIFSWNNKYILKYEQGLVEQTYKINEMEIMDENTLNSFLEGEFLKDVEKRFKEMHESLRNQIENI